MMLPKIPVFPEIILLHFMHVIFVRCDRLEYSHTLEIVGGTELSALSNAPHSHNHKLH